MEYVTLGRTDLRISRICFGCAPLSGYDYGPVDDKVSVAALQRARELGINFFDTADVYGFGHTENILRQAFGGELKNLVVATKFGVAWKPGGQTLRDLSPAHLRTAVEGSLRRLGLETIALYQIHWPDGITRLEDCMAQLEALRAAGKILHYGACNLNADELAACQKTGRLESLQLPFSLAEQRQSPLLGTARLQEGLTTLGYNVLAHGFFSGKYGRTATFNPTDLRQRASAYSPAYLNRVFESLERIRLVAARHQMSCVEVAIAWALAQPEISVALVGSKTPAQIETSVRATSWTLTQTELAFLRGAGDTSP